MVPSVLLSAPGLAVSGALWDSLVGERGWSVSMDWFWVLISMLDRVLYLG